MAGARGYRSYRGRGSKGKIVLAVILVLVIVASLAFIRMQEYEMCIRDRWWTPTSAPPAWPAPLPAPVT